MFGLGKNNAEGWFKSAKHRFEKLNRDTRKRNELQVQRMREGDPDPSAQDEIARIRDKAFRAILSDLEKALEKDPRCVDALFNKGYMHYLLKDHSKALSHFEKALEYDPGHAHTLCCIAKIKKEISDYEEALRYYRKAIDRNADDADAWWEMSEVLKACGDVEAAKKAEEQALLLRPSINHGYFFMYIPMTQRLFT